MIRDIHHQPEGDTLLITGGGVYCRRYRIWFRPNHVLGFLLSDKINMGPVRDKAKAAVAKLQTML